MTCHTIALGPLTRPTDMLGIMAHLDSYVNKSQALQQRYVSRIFTSKRG